MIRFAGPLTREYLESKLNMEKEILAGMERGREPDPRQIRSQSYRIEYIEKAYKTVMKIEKLAEIIEKTSPLDLQEQWDNSGFQIKFDGAEIKKSSCGHGDHR